MAGLASPETSSAARLAELLRASRYEVIPLAGVEEQVLEHVPRDVTLTVTASPTKGLDVTLDHAERFAAQGYAVVPHLSARLVRDRSHLAEVVQRMDAMGVRDVFVVAGDAERPAGEFAGAAALLAALDELGHPFADIGITGYPESHPTIDDETTIAAMFEKSRFATYIASQICFDPSLTVRWVDAVWARGTRLPILVGLPGVVPRAKLVRVSARIGIGESARFLRKNAGFVGRFLKPGGFSPDPLIRGLEPALRDPERKIAGFHIFTFNDVADTERWRRRRLARA
ncbi:Methylenetetrahydrofolate reductase [Gaiella occulta]|uniref:Methylenetetrahydrofolate reductase n=1 Tax=Gaiella occulta TaxID=1002870 RepID=A0A7M2Z217_9ACTN|nr:methylenetetrahydrofolate reductase [Gaiella occulta]RDI76135.1 Methylenetetrahydrofolate reductase [Gaiella occulta]